MKTGYLPSVPEVVREGLITIAGALLAAFVIGQLPGVRDWVKRQWDGVK